MNSLKVNNLCHSYGNLQALKDISFEVKDGLIGVLGPNGAGKTTAMKIITTLFSIEKGDIFLNDLSYKRDLKDVRKQLGYLPQYFTVYGNLKGREFLEIAANIKLTYDKKEISRHIDEINLKLGMEEYIDRKIKEYSGGMKQKLGFAQTLIGNPSLIIMDEPTVGLDPEQRNSIRELLPIISQNRIVFVTTHIVEDIEYYCNYLLVIKEGRLIYKGSKEDFVKQVEGMLWEAEVDTDTFIKISSANKIVTTVQATDRHHIRYISHKPLTEDSLQAKINLQDAYIVHSNMEG